MSRAPTASISNGAQHKNMQKAKKEQYYKEKKEKKKKVVSTIVLPNSSFKTNLEVLRTKTTYTYFNWNTHTHIYIKSQNSKKIQLCFNWIFNFVPCVPYNF